MAIRAVVFDIGGVLEITPFMDFDKRREPRFGLQSGALSTGLVDDLVYSHEVGMSKPDPRIYALTCGRHQVEPAEMVFIDDAPLCVEAAQSFGINAILFEDNSQTIAEVDAFLVTQ